VNDDASFNALCTVHWFLYGNRNIHDSTDTRSIDLFAWWCFL
jgi:hypothetical protein